VKVDTFGRLRLRRIACDYLRIIMLVARIYYRRNISRVKRNQLIVVINTMIVTIIIIWHLIQAQINEYKYHTIDRIASRVPKKMSGDEYYVLYVNILFRIDNRF